MALIFNIDTAMATGSVCLAKDGIPLKILINTEQKDHAAVVAVFIRQILNELNIPPPAIDAIAISGGPGSYTGLRVAAAAAKGLCYAWNKPLIAVNTLEMMANGLRANSGDKELWYCPMIDARRQEVFTAVYDTRLSVIMPPAALILEKEVFNNLLERNRICFFGSGSVKFQKILSPSSTALFKEYQPDASHLASLSEAAWAVRRFEEPAYFEPFYLKSFYSSSKA